MQVSFIVSLFNQLPLTQAMLASLRTSLPASLDWELIFVDDGCTDGTGEWLKTLTASNGAATLAASDPLAAPTRVAEASGEGRKPGEGGRIRVLRQPENLGFAAANNRAAAAATGDVLALLNNDLEFSPGWLEPMLAALESRPDAALVGNVQHTPDGALHHTGVYINARGKPEHDRRRPETGNRGAGFVPATSGLPPVDTIRDVTATTAACALIRREVFTRLHGFDEAFRNGHEDVDLCLRARAAGLRNYVALHSDVVHHVSASRGRDRTKIANSARGMNRWRASLPDLAGEAWRDPHLRPVWVQRLPFAARLRAALSRPAADAQPPAFPAWLRAVVARRIESQLARWRRALGGTLPQ